MSSFTGTPTPFVHHLFVVLEQNVGAEHVAKAALLTAQSAWRVDAYFSV